MHANLKEPLPPTLIGYGGDESSVDNLVVARILVELNQSTADTVPYCKQLAYQHCNYEEDTHLTACMFGGSLLYQHAYTFADIVATNMPFDYVCARRSFVAGGYSHMQEYTGPMAPLVTDEEQIIDSSLTLDPVTANHALFLPPASPSVTSVLSTSSRKSKNVASNLWSSMKRSVGRDDKHMQMTKTKAPEIEANLSFASSVLSDRQSVKTTSDDQTKPSKFKVPSMRMKKKRATSINDENKEN